MQRTFSSATWALAALLAAGTAQASSSAYARFGSFAIDLVDLDPDDGLAPSIEFLADDGFPHLYVRSYSSAPGGGVDGDAKTVNGAAPFGAAAAAVDSPRGSATADVFNVAASLQSMSLAVEGTGLDPWAAGVRDYIVDYHASVQAPYLDIWGDFIVGPGTRVTISAVGDVGVAVAPGHAADIQDSSAYAQVWMRVMSPSFSDPHFQFSTAGCVIAASLSAPAADGDPLGCGSFRGPSRSIDALPLSVSFVNPSGAALTGHFLALAHVSGGVSANLSPVPEPATILLWLAGAVVLAAGHGRRTR